VHHHLLELDWFVTVSFSCADMMLGKEKMAKLRSIAKLHNLATGSQTIPNFVAEIAAAQGKSPLVDPSTAAALPAPEQKKLLPKRAKRKAPRVVSDEEADESTEDGLICNRKRGAVAVPPAAEGTIPDYAENPPNASTPFESAGDVLASNASAAEAVPEQLADTQASSQAVAELPASPTPRGSPRHPTLQGWWSESTFTSSPNSSPSSSSPGSLEVFHRAPNHHGRRESSSNRR